MLSHNQKPRLSDAINQTQARYNTRWKGYRLICYNTFTLNVLTERSIVGMIKDGGTNPSTTCKIAAQQLAADSDVVGVVGAMRSSCSKASHQYFRDNGKRNKGHDNLSKQSNLIYRDRLCCCFDPYCDLVSWCPLKLNPQ